MHSNLTKPPEKPQDSGSGNGERRQTFQEWVDEAKAKGAVKFRLVRLGKKSP